MAAADDQCGDGLRDGVDLAGGEHEVALHLFGAGRLPAIECFQSLERHLLGIKIIGMPIIGKPACPSRQVAAKNSSGPSLAMAAVEMPGSWSQRELLAFKRALSSQDMHMRAALHDDKAVGHKGM